MKICYANGKFLILYFDDVHGSHIETSIRFLYPQDTLMLTKIKRWLPYLMTRYQHPEKRLCVITQRRSPVRLFCALGCGVIGIPKTIARMLELCGLHTLLFTNYLSSISICFLKNFEPYSQVPIIIKGQNLPK